MIYLFSVFNTSMTFFQILIFYNLSKFKEKIQTRPLADYGSFFNYIGGSNYEAACDYILCRFEGLNTGAPTHIYPYYDCGDGSIFKCKCIILVYGTGF